MPTSGIEARFTQNKQLCWYAPASRFLTPVRAMILDLRNRPRYPCGVLNCRPYSQLYPVLAVTLRYPAIKILNHIKSSYITQITVLLVRILLVEGYYVIGNDVSLVRRRMFYHLRINTPSSLPGLRAEKVESPNECCVGQITGRYSRTDAKATGKSYSRRVIWVHRKYVNQAHGVL